MGDALVSRGRRANPVLTYETALRRFLAYGDVCIATRGAIRWMADDVNAQYDDDGGRWVRQPPKDGEVAYLRHAEVGVEENPGTLRCALHTGLWKSAVALRRESANRPCVDVYNRSSAVVANVLVSRGRRANPVLTY